MSHPPALQTLLDLLPVYPALSREETERLLDAARSWAITHKILVPSPAGRRRFLNCPFCDTHTVKPVPRDGAVMYHCPDGGWQRLGAADQDTFTLCPLSFARLLASALGLDPARMLQREEGKLYELGHIQTGDEQRSIFLLVSGDALTEIERLLTLLDARGSKIAGIVLTCQPFPSSIRSRAAHRFVPVSEIAELTNSGLRILRDRLDQWLTGRDRPASRESYDKEYVKRGQWKTPFVMARNDLVEAGEWSGTQTEKIRSAKNWCVNHKLTVKWPSDLSVIKKHMRQIE